MVNKMRLCIVTFLLVSFSGFLLVYFNKSEEVKIAEIPVVNQKEKLHIGSFAIKPDSFGHVQFSWNSKTLEAELDARAVSLLAILSEIARKTGVELNIAPVYLEQLQKKVTLTLRAPLDTLLTELLLPIDYTLVSSSSEQPVLTLCIDKAYCDSPPGISLLGESADEHQKISSGESSPPGFALNASPGGGSSIEDQSKQLKEDFFLADVNDKISIVKSMGEAAADIEFVIDVLLFSENTNVRQAAAKKLFLPDCQPAIEALVETLNDQDPKLVMTVLNVLNESRDDDLRRQVSFFIASHESADVRLTANVLGF